MLLQNCKANHTDHLNPSLQCIQLILQFAMLCLPLPNAPLQEAKALFTNL